MGVDDRTVSPWALTTGVAERALRKFVDDGCPETAGAIAYRVLFSLFPLAIVLAGGFAVFVQLTGVQTDAVDAIVRRAPLTADGREELRELLTATTGGLGSLGLLGVAGLLWAATGMMGALRKGLNAAWDVEEPRPFLQGKLADLGLVAMTGVLLLVSTGLAVGVRVVQAYASDTLRLGAATWPLGLVAPLVLAFASVLFLFRVVPARRPPLGTLWPSALAVAAVFTGLQVAFAVYVEHFRDFNAVYGSLGAIVAFLYFVYLSALVLLLGAEVAAALPVVRAELRAREDGEGEGDGTPFLRRAAGFLRGLAVRPGGRGER